MHPYGVRVNGRMYQVFSAEQEHYGECDADKAHITIMRGMDPFTERDTILHEVMHAILRQQGRVYTATEERIVTALATGLTGVLADNPQLSKYLTEGTP